MILTVTANPAIDRVYLVEDFKMGEVHRVKKDTHTAGGKGLNVSRVATIIGRKVAAMGFVGGYNGEYIKSEIEKQGIKNLFTDISGETRTCINISDKNGNSGEILEQGPEILEEEEQRFIKEYISNIDDSNVICVCGSLPRGLSSDFYIKLILIAKEKGKKIIVDTSGKTLEDILPQKPYMVKPNKDEISQLMGKEIVTENNIKEALLFLFEKGVEIPFISLGKDGAAAMIDGSFYKFSTPNLKVVNSVGSGDSVVAGVSAAIDMGYAIEDAIKLGLASGAANTQFDKTGFVTKELVDEFYCQIEAKLI